MQKYDVGSALAGSAVVTVTCAIQGQSWLTAAGLTVLATIIALVRF
jgi:hypothetical protein